MRTSGNFLTLLAGGLMLASGLSHATAQEEAAPPAPSPQPAPAVEAPPYSLDLPDLHPPGQSLFPNGPRQNPPVKSKNSSGNHRNSLLTGSKQSGRTRDRTLQKADSDPLLIRVAYRRDKTTVLAREPELADLLRRSGEARTDVQKRALLHEYYTRLFASIRRVDSSTGMQAHLALLAQVAELRYDPKRRSVAGEEELLNTRESAATQRLGR